MRSVLAILLVTALALFARRAHASDLTPELASEELREATRTELRRQLAVLEPADQKKLVGTYVAFEPDAADPLAFAACDDDGDHVVVLSDAMLRLLAEIARAQAADESNGSRKIEDYAAFVARSQVQGRKLLPPPAGFYAGEKSGVTADERLREALAFVVGHELARLRAGDLQCPRPTATRESGDDVWTRDEERRALEAAERAYARGATQSSRDDEAITRVVDTGRGSAGALAVLRFFEQLERERLVSVGRFTPTYLTLHPSSATRAGTVRAAAAAAEARRRERERDPRLPTRL